MFWAAFDMLVTVVPLKVALGLKMIGFWALKQNNHASVCQVNFFNYFFEMAKIIFFSILFLPTFNGTTVTDMSKAAQNN